VSTFGVRNAVNVGSATWRRRDGAAEEEEWTAPARVDVVGPDCEEGKSSAMTFVTAAPRCCAALASGGKGDH